MPSERRIAPTTRRRTSVPTTAAARAAIVSVVQPVTDRATNTATTRIAQWATGPSCNAASTSSVTTQAWATSSALPTTPAARTTAS